MRAALVALTLATAAPSANAQTPPILSAEQLQKLDKAWAAYGHDIALNKSVTDALGLTKGDDTLPVRQITVEGDGHPIALHAIERLPNSDGYFLTILMAEGPARNYAINGKQELIAANAKSKQDLPPITIPPAQARKELQEEIKFWRAIADKL
jgi:hypothetical protein